MRNDVPTPARSGIYPRRTGFWRAKSAAEGHLPETEEGRRCNTPTHMVIHLVNRQVWKTTSEVREGRPASGRTPSQNLSRHR
jgi:hypothetical protein